MSGLIEITDLEAWKAEGGSGYLPKQEKEPVSPQTGDASGLWIIVLLVFSAGIVAVGRKRRV